MVPVKASMPRPSVDWYALSHPNVEGLAVAALCDGRRVSGCLVYGAIGRVTVVVESVGIDHHCHVSYNC